MIRPGAAMSGGLLKLAVIVVAAVLTSPASPAQWQDGARLADSVSHERIIGGSTVPPAFISNSGQWPAAVQFAARLPDLDAFFESSVVTLAMRARLDESTRAQTVVKLRFESAQGNTVVEGLCDLGGRYNFLKGPSAAGWRLEVPAYEVLRYRNIQPGIDVEFMIRNERLAFDIHLAPGAEASSFTFACDGITELSTVTDGLLLGTPLGGLKLSEPIAWELDQSAGRQHLASTIRQLDARRFSYDLPNWDRRNPAVIDPGITWSTFLGGVHSDQAQFIESSDDGSVLIGGVTDSFDFPVTPAAFDTELNEGADLIEDVFIAKLDASGSTVIAATLLGGTAEDIPSDVAIDHRGRVIVVGVTFSTDFPVTPNAYDPIFNSSNGDGFVVVLDSTLSQLEYSTCIATPGAAGVGIGGVVATPSGAVVLLGGTFSPDFVATPGAYDTTFDGSSDDIVLKLDPSLPPDSQLIFATFLGGNDEEYGASSDLAIAADGSIIVGHNTNSRDFPVTPGAFDTDFGSGFNSYIAAISPDGSALLWATFVKSTGLQSLVVGNDGALTVCLNTSGAISPVSQSAYDPTPNGLTDALVCRFDSTCSRLLWGTYLGGQQPDNAYGMDVDETGAVMVCGRTESSNFPTTPGAHDTAFSGGCSDGFVAYLSSDGAQLLYSTFLGAGTNKCVEAFAVESLDPGVALVAGRAPVADFPTTPGAYDTSYNGGSLGDGFVLQMPLFTPWTNLGQGLAGTLGVPKLFGSGWLVPGSPTTLALTRAKPGSTAAMIVGFSELAAPFKGGVLVPFPNVIFSGLPVSGSGTLTLTAAWPSGVPANLTFFFQDWIVDPVAVAGLSASNALSATTP